MNKLLVSLFLIFASVSPVFSLQEDFLVQYLENGKTALKTNVEYNYLDTKRIPVKLVIKEKISTRNKEIYEGQKLYFTVLNNVYDGGNLILKKGETVRGELKYLTKSGMNGIPYTMTLGDFEIKDLDENKLQDEYYKQGFDRGYFVFPLKWALTFLPPTGSLTNFIKGGHCKITPNDEITIYYYPNWGRKE